jgi:hypothetical protein
MKIVVFDLDETLGYFTQYGIFWDSLNHYCKIKHIHPLSQSDFDDILDLYPEFLRPNIINILTYLKKKKESKCCHKMMIYTNNSGPKEWSHFIINYFENKIKYKIIDQLISAFKVNGKTIEVCRTSHNKTHKDFIKCTKLPINSEICFLDDTFYPDMANDNIYYINVKPYYYDLTFDYMLDKFKASTIGKKIIENDTNFDILIFDHISLYKYDCIEKDSREYDIDKILGKHIITHLQEFFNKSKRSKTIKNKPKYNLKYNLKHNKTNKTNKKII